MDQRNKMWSGGMKRLLICAGLMLAMMAMMMPPGLAHAQSRWVKPEMAFPDHYPYNGFHGMGHINDILIDKNLVVIDDMTFKLYATTEYHTPDQEHASSALFIPGKFVGYLKDSANTIVSMWLIEMD